MSWRKKNSIDPWDKQIDEQISDEQSQRHSDIAKKITRGKKIRRIVFYSLGAIIPLVAITFVLTYKKIKEPLKFWDSNLKWILSNEAKYDSVANPKGALSWNDAILDGKPEDIMVELFKNPLLTNPILKPLHLKLQDSKYDAKISNLILDTYDKRSLHFDLEILTKEKKPNLEFIIRNFTVNTSKELEFIKQDKINTYTNKNNVKNIFTSINSWKLNFTSSSVYDYNDLTNPCRIEMDKIVAALNKDISSTNYIDRAIKLINYQNKPTYFFNLFNDIKKPFFVPFIFKGNVEFLAEKQPKLKFEANIFSLAKDVIKINKRKYEYGIYIPHELGKTKQISLPIVFKTIAEK
ncbi:hypothetical protein [Metamycoplasma equirhinis]|uniref:hypothetical protein n=1 Tax=Metamycoplasma equirhinis TaxID=92402 RepID=UPI00359461B6